MRRRSLLGTAFPLAMLQGLFPISLHPSGKSLCQATREFRSAGVPSQPRSSPTRGPGDVSREAETSPAPTAAAAPPRSPLRPERSFSTDYRQPAGRLRARLKRSGCLRSAVRRSSTRACAGPAARGRLYRSLGRGARESAAPGGPGRARERRGGGGGLARPGCRAQIRPGIVGECRARGAGVLLPSLGPWSRASLVHPCPRSVPLLSSPQAEPPSWPGASQGEEEKEGGVCWQRPGGGRSAGWRTDPSGQAPPPLELSGGEGSSRLGRVQQVCPPTSGGH